MYHINKYKHWVLHKCLMLNDCNTINVFYKSKQRFLKTETKITTSV